MSLMAAMIADHQQKHNYSGILMGIVHVTPQSTLFRDSGKMMTTEKGTRFEFMHCFIVQEDKTLAPGLVLPPVWVRRA